MLLQPKHRHTRILFGKVRSGPIFPAKDLRFGVLLYGGMNGLQKRALVDWRRVGAVQAGGEVVDHVDRDDVERYATAQPQ